MKNPLFLGRRLGSLLTLLCLSVMLTACGGNDSAQEPPPPPAAPTQLLALQLLGGGSVQSQPVGLSCTTDCSIPFAASSTVTLSATPATDYLFAGWSGLCSGTGTCVVFLDQDKGVTANFTPNAVARNYTLTVALSGSGSVASQPAGINCGSVCSAAYLENTVVTLAATPAANQSFAGWSGACSGAASCVVTLNQLSSVTATFTPITAANFTLTTSVTGNGSISSNPAGIACGSTCAAQYAAGTSVTLTAAPASGQVFNGWSGACSGTQATCVLSLTQSRSAQAAFVAAPPPALTWQPEQLLENSNDFNVAGTNTFGSARVLTAMGPNGDAMVIWEQSDGVPDGSTIKAFSRRYTQAGGWQAIVAVPGLSIRNASLVDGYLFMDATGTATWIRQNKETRRSTAASGWGAVFSIGAVPRCNSDPNSSISSALMNASGDIGILFSGCDVYNNALSAGSNQWGTWTAVDTSGSLVARDARVASSSDGTAIATWIESNPGDSNYSMKAARYTPAGGWGAPQSIEALFTNVEFRTARIAMDAQGNGIAVWAQGNALYYNQYRNGTGWLGEVAVDAGQIGSVGGTKPQIAMAPDGRAVVTWTIGLATLRSMQYHPATGWTTPVTVDSYALEVDLYISDAGQVNLVYIPPINPVTANFDVVSRSMTHGGAWSAPTLLETAAGNVKNKVSAVNRSGQGIAVWAQNDIANSQVRNSLWGAVLR